MLRIPEHLMTSESDGALYDTRAADWSHNPLRKNYCRTHATIDSVADLKATLRAGNAAWPGGYPLYFITSDGAALSFYAARDCFRQIADSIANRVDDGWRIVACEINYEDNELRCDHTGSFIPSAYGDS